MLTRLLRSLLPETIHQFHSRCEESSAASDKTCTAGYTGEYIRFACRGICGCDGRDVRPQMLAEREEEPSPLAVKSAAVSRSSTAPGIRSKVMNTATRKRPSVTEPDTVPVSKQARKMVDRATQTQTLSGRDHTAPLALATTVGRSLSATTDEAIQPPDSFMNEIEASVSKHKHRPAPKSFGRDLVILKPLRKNDR